MPDACPKKVQILPYRVFIIVHRDHLIKHNIASSSPWDPEFRIIYSPPGRKISLGPDCHLQEFIARHDPEELKFHLCSGTATQESLQTSYVHINRTIFCLAPKALSLL
jgi:hypothetical protein